MSEPVFYNLTGFALWRLRMRSRLAMLRRRWIPYLVWQGQPVWVRITFTEAKLPPMEAASIEELGQRAARFMGSGHLAMIESDLREIGIEFDKGAGPEGRDWEFDWSLRGPIEVRFSGTGARKA